MADSPEKIIGWEYGSICGPPDDKQIVEALNKFGLDGWTVDCITTIGERVFILLKRKIK